MHDFSCILEKVNGVYTEFIVLGVASNVSDAWGKGIIEPTSGFVLPAGLKELVL